MAGSPVRARVSTMHRTGATLIGIGAIQFIAAMGVVQSRYAGYSLLTNYISDLGNTATSPWHDVFNISIVLLGILAFIGILFLWSAFPRSALRPVGLALLLIASVAAIMVGLFPENVNPPVHDFVSLMVFLPGGLALALLSATLRPPTWWSSLRWPSLVLGLVTLASLVYYVPTQASNSTFDPGLIERLIVFPILIWALAVFALVLSRPSRPKLAVS
jgi:hypothetical membrane protein